LSGRREIWFIIYKDNIHFCCSLENYFFVRAFTLLMKSITTQKPSMVVGISKDVGA
jgi:hypothetical protein